MDGFGLRVQSGPILCKNNLSSAGNVRWKALVFDPIVLEKRSMYVKIFHREPIWKKIYNS